MKFTYILGIASASLSLLGSCDYVDNPTPPITQVSADCDSLSYTLPAASTQRNVLIEDFTGHKCPNCPAAASEAENIKASVGSQLVIVSIHPDPAIMTSLSGFVQENSPGSGMYETAWYIPEGGQIMSFFGDPGFLPVGMVNRTENTTFSWQYWDYTEWSNEVSNEIAKPLNVTLTGQSKLLANGTVCGLTEVSFTNSIPGDYRVVHYLVEDSIPDWQLDGTSNLPNYLHRHVLRDVAQDNIWGEEVVTGGSSAGETYQFNYSFGGFTVVDDTHLDVIAYVYNDSSKVIEQVIQFPVEPQ